MSRGFSRAQNALGLRLGAGPSGANGGGRWARFCPPVFCHTLEKQEHHVKGSGPGGGGGGKAVNRARSVGVGQAERVSYPRRKLYGGSGAILFY